MGREAHEWAYVPKATKKEDSQPASSGTGFCPWCHKPAGRPAERGRGRPGRLMREEEEPGGGSRGKQEERRRPERVDAGERE